MQVYHVWWLHEHSFAVVTISEIYLAGFVAVVAISQVGNCKILAKWIMVLYILYYIILHDKSVLGPISTVSADDMRNKFHLSFLLIYYSYACMGSIAFNSYPSVHLMLPCAFALCSILPLYVSQTYFSFIPHE